MKFPLSVLVCQLVLQLFALVLSTMELRLMGCHSLLCLEDTKIKHSGQLALKIFYSPMIFLSLSCRDCVVDLLTGAGHPRDSYFLNFRQMLNSVISVYKLNYFALLMISYNSCYCILDMKPL